MDRKQHLLRSALFYAATMGWPVFPCKPRAKDPLTGHGYKDATLDPAQIKAWWQKWPQANIGIPTGVKFWVLDIDPRNGGEETLEALIVKHGPLPDTVQQISGGGGRHFLFSLPENLQIKNGHLGEGIDVKGAGGYIVVAPSVTKQAYVWDGAKPITEQTMLAGPSWLLAEIGPRRNGGGANPKVLPSKIAKGTQHRAMVSMAGSMRNRGAEFPEIFAALVAMNPRLEEPAPEANLRRIAETVCKYEAGKLTLEEPPETSTSTAEDDADGPANPPPKDQDAPPPRAEKKGRPTSAPPLILNCADLLKIETPVRKMLFDGYPLPARGATLKVGAPKSGKTMLAVQEALALVRGKALFDYYSVLQPGPVLVVEQDDPDGAVSIKEIVQLAGGTADLPLYVVPKLPFGFGPNLLDWLGEQITKLALRMVVLDSYTALRGPRGPGIDIVKAEQTELTQLDALAKRTGIDTLIQIIHHGSKGAAGLDWTQMAAGSFAMAASTEAQIHVSRFPELDGAAPERLVRVRGRHAADVQLVLRFRKETLDYEWVLDGAAAPLYPTIEQIRREFGQAVFEPKQLSQALGVARATAFRLIDRLRQAGAIQKRGYGQYFLPER